jgi:hypothetical protein
MSAFDQLQYRMTFAPDAIRPSREFAGLTNIRTPREIHGLYGLYVTSRALHRFRTGAML